MTESCCWPRSNDHQIKRIEAVGQKFDANLHQAMFEVPGTGQPAGHGRPGAGGRYTITGSPAAPGPLGIAKADTAPSGGNGPRATGSRESVA